MMSRLLFHFASFPKFKDEHTMPFTKGQPEELSNLRDMAYGWGKVVSRRAYGEEGPGLDLDFDFIESVAVEMGQAVLRGAIEEALKTQWNLLGDHQPCPECARLSRDTCHEPFRFAAGRSSTTNPSVIARPVAGIFFPLRPSLRLDSHNFSPAILGKIVRAAARSTSFAAAAESLADEAEVDVSGRQAGRIAHEVGAAPATRSGSASRGVGLPIATEKKTTIFRGKPFSRTMVIEKPQDLRVRPRDFAGP